jgi:hypothetical protein
VRLDRQLSARRALESEFDRLEAERLAGRADGAAALDPALPADVLDVAARLEASWAVVFECQRFQSQ